MIGVLLATMGAAALLARSRERRWAIALDPTPRAVGRVEVKLPRGWRVRETPPGAVPLRVVASQETSGGSLRRLEVLQFPTDADNPAALLAAYLATQPGVGGAVTPFDVLGQPGVLAPFVFEERHPLAPQITLGAEPQWLAAVVLPGMGSSGNDLGVVLRLAGPLAGGPSGKTVLRQVADGLALRDVGDHPGSAGPGL